MSLASELAALYRRDLQRLVQEIEAYPEERLWELRPGISNSAGTLTLHLEGNLRHFIGYLLGGISYTRQRELEFSTRGLAKEDLLSRIGPLVEMVPAVIGGLSEEALDAIYPVNVLNNLPLPTRLVLLSLYGHLSYHKGQIDYLRRVLTGNGSIELAGLA